MAAFVAFLRAFNVGELSMTKDPGDEGGDVAPHEHLEEA